MKIEIATIRKTENTVVLIPHLSVSQDGIKKQVAFCIKGIYIPSRKNENLYNRTDPTLPPRLPKKAFDIIMNDTQLSGDIPCVVFDRGCDIEIVV